MHKSFFLLLVAVVSLLFVLVGILALFDYPGAEVIFWTRNPVKSDWGKIAWIAASAACLVASAGYLIYRRR